MQKTNAWGWSSVGRAALQARERGRAKETDSEMPNDLQLPPDSQDKAINLHSPAVKRWDTVKPPHSITMSLISVFSSIPSFHPPHPGGGFSLLVAMVSQPAQTLFCPVLLCFIAGWVKLQLLTAVAGVEGEHPQPEDQLSGKMCCTQQWQGHTPPLPDGQKAKSPWAHDRSCGQQSSGTSFHVVGRGSEALHSPRLQ